MRKVSTILFIVTLLIGINTINSASEIKSITPSLKSGVKLILGWEMNYMKVVCKSIDNNLTDENLAYSNGGINTMIISADAIYGGLPPDQRPILIIPNGNFLSGVYYAKLYPRVNIMMCYLNGNQMSSSYSPSDTAPPNMMFIAGGNVLNDWTTGPRFDFIDSSDIQYVESDLTPRYNYPISNIIKNRDGTAKIYNPIITSQTRVGWQVWSSINSFGVSNITTGSIRSRVLEVHSDSGYIVVNNAEKFPSRFIGGSVKAHWLSGSVTAAAVKISQIMKGRYSSFYEARLCARMTASNNGVRDDVYGYGHLNVQAAIEYELTDSQQREVDIFNAATDASLVQSFLTRGKVK